MEVTQSTVKQFENAQQLLGVSAPMGNGKNINVHGGEVTVGAAVKSAGSSPNPLRRPEDDVMIVAKIGTRGETVKTGPDVKATAFENNLSSLMVSLVTLTVAKCLVYLGLLVLRS